MRPRQLSAPAAIMLLMHLQAACTAYYPARLNSVTPGSNIRVRFSSPSPLEMEYLDGDSVRKFVVADARAVNGTVSQITGEGSRPMVRLSPLSKLAAPHVSPEDAAVYLSASFTGSELTPVAVRQYSPERTGLLVLIAGAVIFTVLVASYNRDGGTIGWGPGTGN